MSEEKKMPDGQVVLTFTREQWAKFLHILNTLSQRGSEIERPILISVQRDLYEIISQVGESYE